MVALTPAPSPRLVRAAQAEREELARHREKLLGARERLRAELARVERSLEEVAERQRLLDRLTGARAEHPPPEHTAGVVEPEDGSMSAATEPLRGPAIRRKAVELLLAHPERPDALHYRDWFEALRHAGYTVAGKDPLAVFLTQLSRSPVVRKGSSSGMYELDRSAADRLRRRLEQLHEELRRLAGASSTGGDVAAMRARRAELIAEIPRVERALDEAHALLSGEQG